ncbi:MAG: hypothetical protein HYY24_21445 [Verrucomicrobia bacterium]|nr:hypothetical protein [Verrucomicrobiota bacterium]
MTAKTISLRIPASLHHKATQMAQRRRVPLDRLFRKALEALQAQEEQTKLRQEFSLLGNDADAADVSFAFAAQSEIANKS